MLYQPPIVYLGIILVVDLLAFYSLRYLPHVRYLFFRLVFYGATLLFVGGTTLLKLLSTVPTPIAFSPDDILIKNDTDQSFQTFFYLYENATTSQLSAFWREYMFGPHKVQTMEMEGIQNVLVAKKINGEWHYQRPFPAWKHGGMILKLAAPHFQPDPAGRVAHAVHVQQVVEIGIFLSYLLTLAVLFLLVYQVPAILRGPGEEPYQELVPTA